MRVIVRVESAQWERGVTWVRPWVRLWVRRSVGEASAPGGADGKDDVGSGDVEMSGEARCKCGLLRRAEIVDVAREGGGGGRRARTPRLTAFFPPSSNLNAYFTEDSTKRVVDGRVESTVQEDS